MKKTKSKNFKPQFYPANHLFWRNLRFPSESSRVKPAKNRQYELFKVTFQNYNLKLKTSANTVLITGQLGKK